MSEAGYRMSEEARRRVGRSPRSRRPRLQGRSRGARAGGKGSSALTPDRPREPGLSSVLRLVPPLRIERRPPALQAGAQTHYARAALFSIILVQGAGIEH